MDALHWLFGFKCKPKSILRGKRIFFSVKTLKLWQSVLWCVTKVVYDKTQLQSPLIYNSVQFLFPLSVWICIRDWSKRRCSWGPGVGKYNQDTGIGNTKMLLIPRKGQLWLTPSSRHSRAGSCLLCRGAGCWQASTYVKRGTGQDKECWWLFFLREIMDALTFQL